MKHLLATLLISVAAAAAAAQGGTIRGQITVKQVSGNNLGNFGCSNITVSASQLGKNGWHRSVTAAGDLSSRRCRFSIPRVATGVPIVVTTSGNFPNGCDLKVFKSDSSFPMTLNKWQTMTYNAGVEQITCTLVK